MKKPIKILIQSNYSRLVTGFGKNMKNILLALHECEEFEVVEAANGVVYGTDMMTPWESHGTYPTPDIMQKIQGDATKERAASYGFYMIDKIVEQVKPDIYLGIEDIWAFTQFENKPWWNKIKTILWTTLDSEPILDQAYHMHKNCDKMLVWATFAEKSMRQAGCDTVETVHGAIDYNDYHPLTQRERSTLRAKHGLSNDYVIGFVFKNQLRKSVPNILEGFKIFQNDNPDIAAKLLLHTDWAEKEAGWDIEKYIEEKGIKKENILATYLCHKCGQYFLRPYSGEDKNCGVCGAKESVKTKNSGKGVNEYQLNEIYNMMDVYCHPFTSGGQELPIQEAKAAGLITLVTSYSCGLDSCEPHQGGLSLNWSEYREPHTNFIKATTCPKNIAEKLRLVYDLPNSEKQVLIEAGKKHLDENFSIQKITEKLKSVIQEVCSTPKNVSHDKQEDTLSTPDLGDLLDGESENRILFVMPESAGDVFMATSLLPSLKKTYPEKDIYFATKSAFHPILKGNPYIHKVLEFHPAMENLPAMEGVGQHKGYFHLCFLPHIGTQRMLDYLHQGDGDKIMFDIHSENFNKSCI